MLGNWKSVQLGDRAIEVQLALTATGMPRMLIVQDLHRVLGRQRLHVCGLRYVAVRIGQTGRSRAFFPAMAPRSSIPSDQRVPQHSFALDPQGRPDLSTRIATIASSLITDGAFYVSCATMCTNANNWKQTQIGRWIVGTGNYEIFNYPSLAFTAAGQPRVTARVFAQNDDGSDAPDGLYYYGCDAGCDQMRNWQRVLLIPTGGGSVPAPELGHRTGHQEPATHCDIHGRWAVT